MKHKITLLILAVTVLPLLALAQPILTNANPITLTTDSQSYSWGSIVTLTVSGMCDAGLTCGPLSYTQHLQPILIYGPGLFFGPNDMSGKVAYAWNVMSDWPMPTHDSATASIYLPSYQDALKATTPDGTYYLALWCTGTPFWGPPYLLIKVPISIGVTPLANPLSNISTQTVTVTVTVTKNVTVTVHG